MFQWDSPTNTADWNTANNKEQLLQHLLADKLLRVTMDRAAKALNVKVARGLADGAVRLELIEYLTRIDSDSDEPIKLD